MLAHGEEPAPARDDVFDLRNLLRCGIDARSFAALLHLLEPLSALQEHLPVYASMARDDHEDAVVGMEVLIFPALELDPGEAGVICALAQDGIFWSGSASSSTSSRTRSFAFLKRY